MEINFIKCEYGRSYGDELAEPFGYIGRIISDKFILEKIDFAFKEIEIQCTFLQRNEKNEKSIGFFNKLPIYYRGENMVRVIVPFSKKNEQSLTNLFQLIYMAF